MEADFQVSREQIEILIGRKNGNVVTQGQGAEEKIGVRALNPFGAAEVKELRGAFIVPCFDRKVSEVTKRVLDPAKLRRIGEARQNFLSNDAREDGFSMVNDLVQFRGDGDF